MVIVTTANLFKLWNFSRLQKHHNLIIYTDWISGHCYKPIMVHGPFLDAFSVGTVHLAWPFCNLTGHTGWCHPGWKPLLWRSEWIRWPAVWKTKGWNAGKFKQLSEHPDKRGPRLVRAGSGMKNYPVELGDYTEHDPYQTTRIQWKVTVVLNVFFVAEV